jgi:hypothetical protein
MPQARVLHVPHEFRSIGSALESARAADIVAISRGRYLENLLLTAPVTLRAVRGKVEICSHDTSLPPVTAGASASGCAFQGITFSCYPDNASNYKVALRLFCAELSLVGCHFRGWAIDADGTLADDDDWWGDLLAGAIHVAPPPGQSSTLTIRDCAFVDCLGGLYCLARGSAQIVGSRFERCSCALELRESSSAILSGNLFLDCDIAVSLGPGISVESTSDTFWENGSVLHLGDASSSSIAISHSVVRARHLMSLAIGDELVRPTQAGWDLSMPKIRISDSTLDLGSLAPEFRFASTARLEWGVPDIDVRDHIALDASSSISVRPSQSG